MQARNKHSLLSSENETSATGGIQNIYCILQIQMFQFWKSRARFLYIAIFLFKFCLNSARM